MNCQLYFINRAVFNSSWNCWVSGLLSYICTGF